MLGGRKAGSVISCEVNGRDAGSIISREVNSRDAGSIMAALAAVPVGTGVHVLTCWATDVGHFPASGRCGCGDPFNCDLGSSISRNSDMVVMS